MNQKKLSIDKTLSNKKLDYLFSIFTHLTLKERLLLLELSNSLAEKATIVEIGSYLGASTSFLAEGIHLKQGKVFAVDTWTNLAMSEGLKDTYEEFLKNTTPFKNWIVALKGMSPQIAEQFQEEIDLLFVDGDHSYEGAKADLEAWLPKVKSGGLVVCHDYNWAEGVRRAVRELLVPLQIDGGRRLDSIYWTRIAHEKHRRSSIHATVAIPTYKRPTYALDALKSVLIQQTDFPYEVLVLDNACNTNLQTDIEKIATETDIPVRYIPVPEIGLHNGRNIAAIEGKGEIIVYIDDDIIAPQGWLAALCEPFQDPKVGGVGGKSVPKWEAQLPNWIDKLHPSYFSLLDLGTGTQEMEFPNTPYGCNMTFRRNLVLELGGFSPDGMGGGKIEWKRGDGETGFAYKVYAQNYKIMYTGEGWLYHRIPARRMTIAAARHRAMKDAISPFYMEMRTHRYRKRILAVKAIKNLCKSIAYNFKKGIFRYRPIKDWIDDDLKAIRYGVTALYQFRLIFDRNILNWVYQDTYWTQNRSL